MNRIRLAGRTEKDQAAAGRAEKELAHPRLENLFTSYGKPDETLPASWKPQYPLGRVGQLTRLRLKLEPKNGYEAKIDRRHFYWTQERLLTFSLCTN